jgi:excisionase family DNA binding protein
MLTTRQLAQLLNVHINTVRRWDERGVLKAYRLGPRGDRRYNREDIDLFLVEKCGAGNKLV